MLFPHFSKLHDLCSLLVEILPSRFAPRAPIQVQHAADDFLKTIDFMFSINK